MIKSTVTRKFERFLYFVVGLSSLPVEMSCLNLNLNVWGYCCGLGLAIKMILKKHGAKIYNNRPESGITGSVKSPLSLHKGILSDLYNTGGL